MRCRIALVLVMFAFSARAQDVLTIGNGVAPAGGSAALPLSIRDRSGTPLGSDAGSGNRIQAYAFKVFFPPELVASVSFARGGVAAALTPLSESTMQGSGWLSYVVSFRETTDPLPFTLNAGAPGNAIGTLTVTLRADAPSGAIAALTFHAPSAVFSNQAGTVVENVAGALALVNGSVTVAGLAAPANLVATAVSAGQVQLTWNAVTGADDYEVWRSFNGGAYALRGTVATAAFSDTNVSAGITYLYRVRALEDGGGISAFSSIDPATTIFFSDNPLVAQSTRIEALHLTELRTAVNAFRLSAGLSPLAADSSIAAGSLVRAQHIATLRTALNQARSAASVVPLSFTDGTLTVGVTRIKAIHVQQLRGGVQ